MLTHVPVVGKFPLNWWSVNKIYSKYCLFNDNKLQQDTTVLYIFLYHPEGHIWDQINAVILHYSPQSSPPISVSFEKRQIKLSSKVTQLYRLAATIAVMSTLKVGFWWFSTGRLWQCLNQLKTSVWWVTIKTHRSGACSSRQLALFALHN